MLVLTETWLRGPGDWLDVPGFTAYHSIGTDRRGGEVSILVKSHLRSEAMPRFTFVSDVVELCSVCVAAETRRYNIFRCLSTSK